VTAGVKMAMMAPADVIITLLGCPAVLLGSRHVRMAASAVTLCRLRRHYGVSARHSMVDSSNATVVSPLALMVVWFRIRITESKPGPAESTR
jgi:hypothetical protein